VLWESRCITARGKESKITTIATRLAGHVPPAILEAPNN
jgi:hypothetical protein